MLIDLLIIIFGISAVYRGRNSGFARQLLAAIGFFGGLLLGRLLEPHTLGLVHTPEDRAVMAVATILSGAIFGLLIGEYAGVHIKYRWLNERFNAYDNSLGSVLSVLALLISIWLMAAVINNLPYQGLKTSLQHSRIISGLNQVLPPAPGVIASLSRLINPNGFPAVFIGNEPVPSPKVDLPALGDLASAVNADKTSVVRLKGEGCGGIVAGSGFVIDKDLVATNAHVVAGISHPFVQDINATHRATVVWFNPDLDFAVLRVGSLAGKPLTLASYEVDKGTPAAVLGYPGGGDFQADPAAVLSSIRAIGRNIYDSGRTVRNVYEVQAEIEHGNSGGPLIAKNGDVIGVIFAESTSYDHVGYALESNRLLSEIAQARHHRPVSTGRCAV